MKRLLCTLLLTALLIGCAAPDPSETRATLGDTTNTSGTDQTGSVTAVSNGSIEFIGYGPGSSHRGSFNEWNATLYELNNSVTGATVNISMSSLTTGIQRLDQHLRSDAFFNADEHPTATFEARNVSDGEANGTLDMNGVRRTIEFPLNVSENTVSSRFNMRLEPFNISNPAITGGATILFDLNR